MGKGRPPVAAWWRDAKFGIFVHWTPASVAGFAPTGDEIGELIANKAPDAMGYSPYTEWYENSLRFPGSPVANYHREHYGDRPYEAFAAEFEAGLDQWDPQAWARTFRDAGARYVVMVTKHHDGYCLWPTGVVNPHRANWHTKRDVVGELADAVRAEGLRFGVYYSGGLDWTFNDTPIGSVAGLVAATPRGAYPAYADAQVRELIDRYRPSVLWNDITWPDRLRALRDLFNYYDRAVPDGVVNDRWLPFSTAFSLARTKVGMRLIDEGAARSARRERGIIPPRPPLYDVRTPEYTVFDKIQREPWECVRGMDRSFGFNRTSTDEHRLTRSELVESLTDIAAKNGNLLLNVGPRGEDAQIPEVQLERLAWAGQWMDRCGEALYDTRPWVRADARTAQGTDVRFTCRGRHVWAILLGPTSSTVTIPGVAATPTTEVVGRDGLLTWRDVAGGIEIDLGDGASATTSDTADGTVVRFLDLTAGPESR